METTKIRGRKGWSDIQTFESRGKDFVVTQDLEYEQLRRVTHVHSGYCAAKRLGQREAEILAVVYDRLFQDRKRTSTIIKDYWKLPKEVRIWLSFWLHRMWPNGIEPKGGSKG